MVIEWNNLVIILGSCRWKGILIPFNVCNVKPEFETFKRNRALRSGSIPKLIHKITLA